MILRIPWAEPEWQGIIFGPKVSYLPQTRIFLKKILVPLTVQNLKKWFEQIHSYSSNAQFIDPKWLLYHNQEFLQISHYLKGNIFCENKFMQIQNVQIARGKICTGNNGRHSDILLNLFVQIEDYFKILRTYIICL